jgi:hypothetical protein
MFMEELENKMNNIDNIFEQFIQNIESVEIFFQKFSLIAIEEDKSILESKQLYFEETIKQTLGEEALLEITNIIQKKINESDDDGDKKNLIGEIPKEKYHEFIYKMTKAPKIPTKNFEILSNSTFLILNNYFEFLFADLLTFHFTNNKNLIEEKNITISLTELKNYSNLEEAYNEILFKEVEKLLLDLNFEEIKNYFKKLGVSLSNDFIDWDFINEIRERRHLLVHNNAIVNKKYIAKSGNPYKLDIGEKININPKYLKSAIDEIQIAGVLLIINCWGKWSKETATDAINEILTFSFNLLVKKKYSMSIKICEYIEKNIIARDDDQENCVTRAKFNHCIALKRLKKENQLQKKLNEIRTGTLSPIFKVAKNILSNKYDTAIDLFPQAILVDNFIIDQYLEWPIFEELRTNIELHKRSLKQFNQKLLN